MNWREFKCKRIERRISNVTKCQNWSSWLYNLVSNLQFFTIYVTMWMESASDIYIYSFISKLYLFYKLFHDFIRHLFSFKVISHQSLYGFATMRTHFCSEEIMLHSDWLIKLVMDSVAVCHIFTLLKLISAR